VPERVDALVLGGGFYGAAIARHLARRDPSWRVALVEREPRLLARASYANQARIHNGYHYPRSFTTAYRSRVNLPRFVADWPQAVHQGMRKLYAIARVNSKVTPRQFERFCRNIGATLAPAERHERQLFEPRLIAAVYAVDELAFDARVLAAWAEDELRAASVEVHVATRAAALRRAGEATEATLVGPSGDERTLQARLVLNCTYSGLHQIEGLSSGCGTALKHELTEMALVDPPAALAGLAITVMDGPFFSLMPFPPAGAHTLSHVRYTPHAHWFDRPGDDPYRRLAARPHGSRADRMVRDAARYLPTIADLRQVGSLYEVKTVLCRNETDDGRPILFERHAGLPGCYSVLGGKIDNVYDAFERLDAELGRT
jgi:glycine/D-amino acid oxidase-like deaminating enzyme